MCAPRSVVAIEPVGMTKASTTKARNTNARMKAIRMDSMVSFTPLPVVRESSIGLWVGKSGFSAHSAVGGRAGVREPPMAPKPTRCIKAGNCAATAGGVSRAADFALVLGQEALDLV